MPQFKCYFCSVVCKCVCLCRSKVNYKLKHIRSISVLASFAARNYLFCFVSLDPVCPVIQAPPFFCTQVCLSVFVCSYLQLVFARRHGSVADVTSLEVAGLEEASLSFALADRDRLQVDGDVGDEHLVRDLGPR